jgi:hypothetical protein
VAAVVTRVDADTAAARLEANATAFRSLVAHVSPEQARWKPSPEQWSILEVVNHLADEEVDDFRRRIVLTLRDPAAPWPPIDPPRWAIERRYNERELGDSLERFLAERRRSVDWLRELHTPDWEKTHQHPKAGPLRAGDLLASWLDHDLIHVRQITRLHHQWLVRAVEPFRTEYAGGF